MRRQAWLASHLCWIMALWALLLPACESDRANCREEETTACVHSISTNDSLWVGDLVEIAIQGELGWCSSLARIETEARDDTLFLRPIASQCFCPDSPCAPQLRSFADTVRVTATRPGRLFTRVSTPCGDLIDSSYVRPSNADPYTWSDRQIREIMYSPYWYPVGFYQEDPRRGYPYYVNTVSINSSDCQSGTCWIELCTDDRAQALAWSESSAVHSSYYRVLESDRETEKYFEFRRVNPDRPSDVILDRVHKCRYLDRSMYDGLHPSSVLAVFVPRPITAEGVREVVEYLWANDKLVPVSKVLASRTTECAEAFCQTILYAILIEGDWGLCDEIRLREAVVRVNKETGEITSDTRGLRIIQGTCRGHPWDERSG